MPQACIAHVKVTNMQTGATGDGWGANPECNRDSCLNLLQRDVATERPEDQPHEEENPDSPLSLAEIEGQGVVLLADPRRKGSVRDWRCWVDIRQGNPLRGKRLRR